MEIAEGEIWTLWRVLHHQFSVLDVDGLPDLSSLYTEFLPFLSDLSTGKFYCAINNYHRIQPAFDE
jgi:hypothetical protein